MSPRFEKAPGNQKSIDAPRPGETIYDECISIAGWIYYPARDPGACRVRAWIDGEVIGETHFLFIRSDVCDFLSVASDVRTGFRLLARLAQPLDAPRDATIGISVSWSGDATEYHLGKVPVHLVPAALRQRHYGEALFPMQSTVFRRENIYGSGPPILEPGAEMLRLILESLSPGSSVVDVGCGAGAYAAALRAAGHQWTGLEVNPHCLELLEQRGLPFRKIIWDTLKLPGANREFDEAICIEVLEHIEQPVIFLAEISRLVRRQALFSVPNLEVIPYYKDWEVVPWHLLEADHKNFFTRTSLRALLAPHFARVEVFSAIEQPLRMRDGVPLHGHLFALAQK